MKIVHLSLSIALLASSIAQAQESHKVTIDKVQVYLSGAAIESSTTINLPKGESKVLFTNVAGNIVEQSLTIGVNNGVIVQEASPKNDYLIQKNLSPKAQMIKDSISLLQDSKATLEHKKKVVEEQLAVFAANKKVAGEDKGLEVVELQKMLDLMQGRLNSLYDNQYQLNKQIVKQTERIQLLQKQLQEEQRKDYIPGGQLLVSFYTPQATSAKVQLRYVSPNASWSPSYDLRVAKINSPVQIIYKANIVQNTGVSWDNVNLSLSTGNPNEGANAPQIQTWFLSFYEPQYAQRAYGGAKMYSKAAPQAELAELSISADAAPAPPAPSTINDYVQVDNSGINTQFDIALKYSIPSDGQKHLVAIKDYSLAATYRYVAIPKLDKDAFLQARVSAWEDLNLIPATTQIFFEDTYVGQGYLDLTNPTDTLDFSLGRDKKIIIKRENDKNYRSVKTIGTNIKRSYGFNIEVKNTKKEAIDLVLFDQFPISNDKDIEIFDKEAPGALINPDNGTIQWPLNISAGASKQLKINYSIKYPKDKKVQGI